MFTYESFEKLGLFTLLRPAFITFLIVSLIFLKMRVKQVAVTNGLILTAIIIPFTIINIRTISFAQYFLTLGILMLIQGASGLINGESTRSFIPIIKQVAIYEKHCS